MAESWCPWGLEALHVEADVKTQLSSDSSQCVFIVIKTGSSSELLLLGTQQATEPFCIYLALSVKRKCQYIHVP